MTDQPLRIPDEEIDYDGELVFRYQGRPFTGIGYSHGPSGGLCEITYRDGMQDGPARDWFPSGQLKSESSYWENSLHGREQEFDEAGNVIYEATDEYGFLMHSVRKDPHHQIVEEFNIDPHSWRYSLLERYRREIPRRRQPG